MTTRNPTIRSFLNGKHSKKTVFNFVYDKVLKQGKASLDNNADRCAYRSDNGKCAAGHLVPDRDMNAIIKADPTINNGGVYSLLDALDIPVGANGMKISFIRDLQRAHDESAFKNDGRATNEVFVEQYKKKMKDIAKKHGL